MIPLLKMDKTCKSLFIVASMLLSLPACTGGGGSSTSEESAHGKAQATVGRTGDLRRSLIPEERVSKPK